LPSSGWKVFWRKPISLAPGLRGRQDAAMQPSNGADVPAPKFEVPCAKCTVVIGHSHIMALFYVQQDQIDAWQAPTIHLHWILLQDREFQPNIVTEGNRTVLSPAVRRRLDKEIASLREVPPFLCASIGGNEYQFIGHVEHPRPFDFSLPERPDLAVRCGVEIIAPSLMRKTLERSMAHSLSVMSALREATSLPIVFLQPPPPVASADYIRANAGPFQEAIQQNGVASASVRMKLWLLQSSIYRQRCDDLGCRYLEVPREVVDSSGFLQESASWPDSVHGNRVYGASVIRWIDQEFQKSREAEVTQ